MGPFSYCRGVNILMNAEHWLLHKAFPTDYTHPPGFKSERDQPFPSSISLSPPIGRAWVLLARERKFSQGHSLRVKKQERNVSAFFFHLDFSNITRMGTTVFESYSYILHIYRWKCTRASLSVTTISSRWRLTSSCDYWQILEKQSSASAVRPVRDTLGSPE